MIDRTANCQQDLRDAARVMVQKHAILRKTGGQKLPATLVNATTSGFCLEALFSGVVGQTYWVKLPDLESQAVTLQWSQGNMHGFALQQPLHPAVLQRVSEDGGFAGQRLVSIDGGRASATPPVPQYRSRSRREQIFSGIVHEANVLKRKEPREDAEKLDTMIRRTTARRTDMRNEPRFPAPLEAAEVLLDDKDAQALDLSASGVRVSGEIAKGIGSNVAVCFAGYGEINGRIVWMRDGMTGVSLPQQAIDLS